MLTIREAAVAVVGRDPALVGAAALDLARATSLDRPVTIVDLIGQGSGLEWVVLTDDDHGVADCFEYGVSFHAVARTTFTDAQIAVILPGTEPIAYSEVLPSPRWTHLVEEAREEGWLVIFAALEDTPALDALTARVDRVIGSESVGTTGVPASTPLEAPIQTSGPARRGESVSGNGGLKRVRHRVLRIRERAPRRTMVPTPFIGVAAGLVLAVVLGTWIVWRRTPGVPGSTGSSSTDTVTSTAQLANRDAAGHLAAPGTGSTPSAAVVDPADSARSASYAFQIGSFGSFADALHALRRGAVRLGGATITPVPVGGSNAATASADGRIPASTFLVYVGAGQTAAAIDSARRGWGKGGAMPTGTVVRTPYALRLMDGISPDSARRAVVSLRSRGVPAYSLVNDGGRASVYAGAFQTVAETASLSASLHAAGLSPVVSYRVGRAL